MRILLTSGGVTNTSIRAELVRLLGRPVAESHALAIPTAGYGHPMVDPTLAYLFISGRQPQSPMTDLGWKSVGVLELTALPSIGEERWVEWVRAADVLLVNGGDAAYLAHWMHQSRLAALLPVLDDVVWLGLSVGSMVMTPRVGKSFVHWPVSGGADEMLGFVDFSVFPHLDSPGLPSNTLDAARRWAQTIGGAAYAIDDDTAISVVDGVVMVVSEGRWEKFDPRDDAGSEVA